MMFDDVTITLLVIPTVDIRTEADRGHFSSPLVASPAVTGFQIQI